MSKTFDVCIRGDGVVGRTLALLLARERLRVALVGRPQPAPAGPPATDVRAYALNSASRKAARNPARLARCAVCHAGARKCRSGATTAAGSTSPPHSVAQDALAWIVDVPALEQQLAQAVRYQPQIEIAGRAAGQAALTVVCEGKAQHQPRRIRRAVDVKPYPQQAIAARLDCRHAARQGVARQWFADGEILALLPLGGQRRERCGAGLVCRPGAGRGAGRACRRKNFAPPCKPSAATTRWAACS